MEFIIFIAIIVLLSVSLVLGTYIPLCKENKEACGNIVNYDSTMCKFVYKIFAAKADIINQLQHETDADDLSCSFDFEKSIITLKDYNSSGDYFFQIQECNGFSILRLKQVSLISIKGYIPYKLNPFLVKKLNAEIIPFSQYGF